MFYTIDNTRLTWGEYFRLAPSWRKLPFFLLAKMLRIRVAGGVLPGEYEPYLADPDDIPEEVRAGIEPLEAEMSSCGFFDPVYYWLDNVIPSVQICIVNFRHRSGTSISSIIWDQRVGPKGPQTTIFKGFSTPFCDGSSFVSTTRRQLMLEPPERKVRRHPGTSISELWNIHRNESSLESLSKTIRTINSRHELLDYQNEEQQNYIEFQVNRGVFVPLEDAVVRPSSSTIPQANPQTAPLVDHETGELIEVTPVEEFDPAFAAVYAEIKRLANRKTSWKSAIFTLIASVILFCLLWENNGGMRSVAILVGVLFFHECGHLAAMRLFRYRNLRMLFIPFMGAAVTGQNYNVPGWKKSIVSLMGPLPGLFLGGVLGICAAINHWPGVLSASYMLLALNLFNLLPVMPLDGGQLMHAVLFSRHPIIDCFFRAVAGLLLLVTVLAGMRGLFIIGIMMLVGLPTAYRVARVVYRLRKSGFDAHSPDACTVPVETARVLHHELRKVLPANTAVRTTAQLTLNAFELLNAKPPGLLASLALIGIHGFSFIAGLILLLGLVFSQNPLFKQMIQGAGEPQHPLEAARVIKWEGRDAREAGKKGVNTIVANFANPREARKSYQELAAKLPPQASVTLFGQTVLVTLPDKENDFREKWVKELNQRCNDVLMQQADTLVSFELNCSAPNAEAAKRLADEAAEYFELPERMHAIPPWSPEHRITEQDRKARRTYLEIKGKGEIYRDPRWTTLNDRIREARQRGDKEAIAKLTKERHQLFQDLTKEHLQRLRNEGEAKWDLALLDSYEKSPPPEVAGFLDENVEDEEVAEVDMEKQEKQEKQIAQWQKDIKKWELEFGSHLGQLPLEGDEPAAGANRFSARGTATAPNRQLHFGMDFERPADGAPALIKWLSQKDCVKMKYDFQPGLEED